MRKSEERESQGSGVDVAVVSKAWRRAGGGRATKGQLSILQDHWGGLPSTRTGDDVFAPTPEAAASRASIMQVDVKRDRWGSLPHMWRLARHRRSARKEAPMVSVQPRNVEVQQAAGSSWPGGSSGANGDEDSAALLTAASLCRPLQVVPCIDGFTPSRVHVSLNANVGRAAVVVLDGLVSELQRAALLDAMGGPQADDAEPPHAMWERGTVDGVGLPPSWGMRQSLLRELEDDPPQCVLEVHARLCSLYPEYHIAHMPSFDEQASGRSASRSSFVANAAVYGDCFQWHVDADTRRLPHSAWRDAFGDYTNGEPGKPLLVSLIVYCNPAWQSDWDAETLFVHEGSGAGLCVHPRPARAVLMHQDVLHRVSTPSMLAKRPRYSLVWKLVFVPRRSTRQVSETICRREWGDPVILR